MRSEILEIRAQFPHDPLGDHYHDLTEAAGGKRGLLWGADDPVIAEDLRRAVLANQFDIGVKLRPPEDILQINRIFSQFLGRKFENQFYYCHRQLEGPLFSISAKENSGESWWVLGGKVENRYTGRNDGVYLYFGPLKEGSSENKVLMPLLFKMANFVVVDAWDDLDKCKEIFPDRQPTVCLFFDFFSSDKANWAVFLAVSRGLGAYLEAGQLFFDEGKKPLVIYPTAYTPDLGLYLFHYGPLGNSKGLMLLSPEFQGYHLTGFSHQYQPPYYLFDRYGKKG